MVYLLIAIINAIYGILLLLTLSTDTPGFYIVFAIGSVLTVLGLIGFALWIRVAINPDKEDNSRDVALKSWFSLARSFDIVLVLGLIFRAFIIQPFIVDGISMEPNLHDKEVLLVDKLSYDFRDPTRGEVVIFKSPPSPQIDYIKRIIGIPGDTVVIEKGQVSISGVPLKEPYIQSGGLPLQGDGSIARQTLKPGEYFVMGDNREHSSDSREWGVLPKINIVGRALVMVYPLNDAHLIKNPEIILPQNQKSSGYLLLPRQILEENFDRIDQWQKRLARF